MTEGIKTLIYLGVALLVALVAFISRPKIEEFKVSEQEGKVLFEKFDDPAKADRLEIVKYDESMGTTPEVFSVARDKASGAWTLPSHGGYPADAETRVRDAALLLVDLQILGIASTQSGDHRLFGVVEPDKDKLKVGDEGVGLLVRFEDAKGQDLASLIIGKKVKGSDDQRFVREPKKDAVYTVRIDPDKLSTKFQDWIEKDLFKDLKAWDVENVALKNYTVSLQPPNRVLIDKKFDLLADFKDSEWKVRELKKYTQGEGAVMALSDQEELNKDKLNDLKTAVDELEIADVRRKPKGLGADLKAGEGYAKDDEGVLDLAKHGFYMVPTASDEVELLSANGEISVATKDGVEYVLRFGETQENTSGAADQGQDRYLFVTTRVDMAKFPQPELQPLPELPTGAKTEAKPEAKTEAKPEAKTEAKPEAKTEAKTEAKPEAKTEAKPEAKTEAKPEAKTEAKPEAKTEVKPEAKAEAKPEEKPEAKPEAKPAETASETAKPTASDEPQAKEAAPAEAKPEGDAKAAAEAKPDAAAAKSEAKTDKEAQESEIVKERERINKENQRKIDERNDKIKKAKETVAKENTRFADWYYLVSDKTFKKVQLNLDDVIKKKESKDGEPVGDGVDAFRKLQSEGLKKE